MVFVNSGLRVSIVNAPCNLTFGFAFSGTAAQVILRAKLKT
jgi:hypothetical protein